MNAPLTFMQFRSLAAMAGVESICCTASPQQVITLRGSGIEVSHSWHDDNDFEDALTRTLKEFSKVRLGWKLRNPDERGDA